MQKDKNENMNVEDKLMNRKVGVILSYVLMVFEVLSTLLLTPFIIRTLGQAEYGVYKLVVAINAYLLLLDLGVGNAIIRYIAKYRAEGEKEKEKQFIAIATIFYLLIAAISIIIGIVLINIFPTAFSKGLSYEEVRLGQKLLGITFINSAVTLGTTAYNNIIIAYEKFTASRVSSILQIVIRMILTYVTLIIGWGSIGIVIVNLLMTILCRGFFVYYVVFKLHLWPQFRNIKFNFIKEILVYSSWILLQMIATQINASVDQILLGSLVPASAVILAVYGVGTQIVQYFQSIGSSFTGVLMPGVVKLVENDTSAERLTNEMIRIGRIIFMVLALIWYCFLINGKEFIILWAGIDNQEAYTVAIILMTVYIFILTESIGTQILWAMNEHKEQAILKLLIVVMNIVLTITLIKWKPLIGATTGTFISLLLGDVVVMNMVFKRKIHISLRYYYMGLLKGILPCLIMAGGVGYFIRLVFPKGWIWLVVKVASMVFVYAIMMYIRGMSEYEKALINSIMNKVIKIGGK